MNHTDGSKVSDDDDDEAEQNLDTSKSLTSVGPFPFPFLLLLHQNKVLLNKAHSKRRSSGESAFNGNGGGDG
jgi:hypothetical protein